MYGEVLLTTRWKLFLICLGALVLRVSMVGFVRHPGIADPNHYYNLGRELAAGNGFQIDYIWQYYNPPDEIVHPIDWWHPLTGVLVAASMGVFGANVQAGLLPFIIIGSVLPVVAYLAARQLGCTESAGLFAGAATGVLPELVMNSLRTDTLIPNTLLVMGCIILLVHGLLRANPMALLGSGLLGGLAYLTRSENLLLLPMYVVTLAVYTLFKQPIKRSLWPYLVLMPLVALGVALPWLWRNLSVMGWLTPPHQSGIFFWTDFRDLYAYDRELSWGTMTSSQTGPQIIAKRLFEMAASVKIMYTTLDVFLPVVVIGGMILLVAKRDRERLLVLTPTMVLLGGVYFFYTVLAPFFSQGGSFKKAYLTLVPLLIPVGAYALEQVVENRRLRVGTMVIVLGLMGANAIELTRADIGFTNAYLDEMEQVVDTVQALPDTNGDGRVVLMSQDPFMMSFLGLRSVAIPMEDRDTVLDVGARYHVDYLMMPPARPSLDPIYEGEERDPRFVRVRDIPGKAIEIYRMVYGVR